MKCAMLVNSQWQKKVFDSATLAAFSQKVELISRPSATMTPGNTRDLLAGADVAVTCWDSVKMEKDILDSAPNLKLVAHAAGSVKPIVSDEFIRRGIKVTTSAPALSIGVAEYILGAILMMGKRLKDMMRAVDSGGWRPESDGRALEMFRAKVGIVGAGFVGRHLVKLLKNFDLAGIWVHDPYLKADEAASLGVEKKSLEEIFSTCDYISLCAPSTPATRGMITKKLIGMIRDDAVFINAARSAIVDESALVAELKTGRFLAMIDVTDPEPAVADHPLRNLPNVIFTPHVAGAVNRNLLRNGAFAAREIVNFAEGKPLVYPVDLTRLDQLA